MGPNLRRYADCVIEVIGDSERGDEFALTHALAEAVGLHGTQPIKWRYATAVQ